MRRFRCFFCTMSNITRVCDSPEGCDVEEEPRDRSDFSFRVAWQLRALPTDLVLVPSTARFSCFFSVQLFFSFSAFFSLQFSFTCLFCFRCKFRDVPPCFRSLSRTPPPTDGSSQLATARRTSSSRTTSRADGRVVAFFVETPEVKL